MSFRQIRLLVGGVEDCMSDLDDHPVKPAFILRQTFHVVASRESERAMAKIHEDNRAAVYHTPPDWTSGLVPIDWSSPDSHAPDKA